MSRHSIDDDPEDYSFTDGPRRRREERDERDESDEPISTLIPYKNPKALTAYYLGVFSLIPCVGLILGPLALVFGILGLNYVKDHPAAKGTGHAIAGVVLGSLTTLGNFGVLLVFGGYALLQ
jgi:hypothetical protein